MTRRTSRVSPQLLENARELRSECAPAESKIWSRIKNRRLGGLKFRRQVPIGNYVADFVCAELGLIVELDGDSHFEPGADRRDALRTLELESRNYRVVRFTNVEVFENCDGVLEAILEKCEQLRGPRPGPSPRPSPPRTGERE